MINLADWIKSKFKSKDKYSDSYIHSTFIESSCKSDNTIYYFSSIILFEFTDDKLSDVCEFLSVANLEASKLIYTSLDIESGVDKYGDPIYKSYPKNYLLIKITTNEIVNLFKNIDKLSNKVLECLKTEIYTHMPKNDFKSLYQYDILNFDNFLNDNIPEDDFMYCNYDDFKVFMVRNYDILSKLPKCFNSLDIIPFITVLEFDKSLNSIKVINNNDNKCFIVDILYKNDIFKNVFKNNNEESSYNIITLLSTPVFNRNIIEEDELLYGNLEDSEIDDIFKQQYDKFTNVNDNIIYKDIDEIVDDDIKTDEELKEEENNE